MSESLSIRDAQRIALAAQGFRSARPKRGIETFSGALDPLHVLQIDSVNVFARSHYLPVFSRQGSYDTASLDEHLWRSGKYTEYWAHEAAFVPVADRGLFQWRMEEFRERHRADGRAEKMRSIIERVRRSLAEDGPQFTRELGEERAGVRGPWWDWSDTKRAVEMLFAWGEVVSAERLGFQRKYALAEDVLPEMALESVPKREAQRALVERAARAHGVGTLTDLADYHRLRTGEARLAVRDLEEEGVLVPVQVEGWVRGNGKCEQAWLHRDAEVPGRLAPDALLTPFDPVVWFRPRAERLFDFHYRIEIYTPKEKRQYGYYCLPILIGGRIVARVDLKADRRQGALLVQAAWQEPGAPARTPETVRKLLSRAAEWQGLQEVRGTGAGNLSLDLPQNTR